MNERTRKTGNRICGLLEITLGGFGLTINNPAAITCGAILVAGGVADAISGEHSYLMIKAYDYISSKRKGYNLK
jgi:hypothetical protein